jgi:type I restriction enzyme R subunit
MFYSVDGKPLSLIEFIESLYNTLTLPEFFKDEAELRLLWSQPNTRQALLAKLESNGFSKADLIEIQNLIDATDSDLFDVLEYISYARKPITRAERVANAQGNIYNLVNAQQRDFIDFVLRNYVQDGVDELDISKLSTTLTAKYGGVYEAQRTLGDVDEIKRVFVDFQQHLYVA